MKLSKIYDLVEKALTGLRLITSARGRIDAELFALQKRISRMRQRSRQSMDSLDRLTRHIRRLITEGGQNSETEKRQVLMVVESLEETIKLVKILDEAISETDMQIANSTDKITEIHDLGYMVIHKLATAAQVLHPNTMPMLVATSPDFMVEMIERILTYGGPTLEQVAETDPELVARLKALL